MYLGTLEKTLMKIIRKLEYYIPCNLETWGIFVTSNKSYANTGLLPCNLGNKNFGNFE